MSDKQLREEILMFTHSYLDVEAQSRLHKMLTKALQQQREEMVKEFMDLLKDTRKKTTHEQTRLVLEFMVVKTRDYFKFTDTLKEK